MNMSKFTSSGFLTGSDLIPQPVSLLMNHQIRMYSVPNLTDSSNQQTASKKSTGFKGFSTQTKRGSQDFK
jgi:hypothetical protein